MTAGQGTRVVVRPAGAERETLFVALLCLAILLAAGTAVGLRTRAPEAVATQAWQVDARDGLTAAEQGINADLRVAADDIAFALEGGGVPTPEELAEDALPPFARDATTAGRGGHAWSLVPAADGFAAWLGRSAAPDAAGSLLLRIATEDRAVSVWLDRSADAAVPGLSDEALIAAGWKEVVSSYDASVTRGHAHDR
ncbi:DUF6162 family protein [Shinella pollutisoli]|uniref:DUF6162 family protein n=1 Tax=Shinella pollutisoli TaxID=2250594 RepID=A0ABV7DJR8_9HYPH|nr:DUF6162 family protein [Shinella pollutisoli]